MSVIEAVKVYKEKTEKVNLKQIKKMAFEKFVSFLGGLLFSFAGFGNGFSPFGVAFSCSMPGNMLLLSTIGSVIGYFITLDSVAALRYTATSLAMAVIMISLRPFKSVSNNRLAPVAVSFVCLLVTGLAVALADGLSVLNVVLSISESAIGGASAYVFSKCRGIFVSKIGLKTITCKDATSVIIAFTLLLLSINSISFFGIYPAHIIACLLILVCGFYSREAGGAIVGICAGITMTLNDGNVNLLAFYSLGGLLCGAFSAFGRFASMFAFIFSGIAVTVLSYGDTELLPLVIEVAVSCVLFVVSTSVFGSKLEEVLVPAVSSPVVESVKADVVSKLQKASRYSTQIYDSIQAVNEALSRNERNDSADIIHKTKNKVCGSCGLYNTCWQESAENTLKNFGTLLELKRNGIYLEYKTVPQSFASSCIRTENISSSFNNLYSEYKIRFLTESRIKELHSIAAGQFMNVSALLDSLSDSIHTDVKFDMDASSRVKQIATELGLKPIECVCVMNAMDKLRIEISLLKSYDKKILKDFHSRLCVTVNKKLDLPETEIYDDYEKLIYKEQAEYKVVSAGVQFNANGQKHSGDSYSVFYDDNGYCYAVICDGMGTGTGAAVTSSFAVSLLEKLIKAGFGIKPAIKTVNSCLASKTGDECSSSLDLLVVDLYTGYAEFYKCGAADSLVKRHGKVVDIGFDSMPLGILNECDFAFGSGNLDGGDVVVMCSDGVRIEDYYDLRRQLKSFTEGSVKDFTQSACNHIRRSQPEKTDDITLLTLAITKN